MERERENNILIELGIDSYKLVTLSLYLHYLL